MDSELNPLQGRWAVKSLEIDEMTLPAQIFATAAFEVTGERFISHGMGAEYAGTIAVNAAAMPHEMDMYFDSGPEKGNTNLAIYELAGDALKLCIATRGTIRPAAFATTPGSGIALETLQRAQAAAA